MTKRRNRDFYETPARMTRAQKTKTKQARTVPISSRLRAILDMRKHDPDGDEHAPTAYVFGTETGERLTMPKRP